MPLIQAKQIEKLITGAVKITGVMALGTSNDITTEITTALALAGFNQSSVPLQPSTNETEAGIIVTGENNQVQLNSGKIKDFDNNEVYGRITEASEIYTLSYYSEILGVETAYNFAIATPIDFKLNYRFDLVKLPTDFAVIPPQIGKTTGTTQRTYTELLTVTARNVISRLSKTPDNAANILLIINEAVYTTLGANPPFTVSGKTITWNSTNGGFSIELNDKVIAYYTSEE